jgi:hypothetical protein
MQQWLLFRQSQQGNKASSSKSQDIQVDSFDADVQVFHKVRRIIVDGALHIQGDATTIQRKQQADSRYSRSYEQRQIM